MKDQELDFFLQYLVILHEDTSLFLMKNSLQSLLDPSFERLFSLKIKGLLYGFDPAYAVGTIYKVHGFETRPQRIPIRPLRQNNPHLAFQHSEQKRLV